MTTKDAEAPPELLKTILSITPNGMEVLERRYLRKGVDGKICETPQQMFWRVASFVASARDDARKYYEMMASLKFFPNSPTFTGAGTPLGQLAACFVLAIDDDMGKDSDSGIFSTLRNAALIQQTGGGVGFSFSRLRPKGDVVHSSGGHASGPVSFLKVYDTAFGAIAQGGTRRGANMAVLRVDHPDIEEFVTCKSKEGTIVNFNISVGLTDKFMEAVNSGGRFDLVNPRDGSVTKTLDAAELFESIAKHAHRNGEPGVLFLDTANRSNPVGNIYVLEATNPCGEQWLGPDESCCLGSMNLARFVRNKKIAWEEIADTARLATRFLDDVISANSFVPAVPMLKKAALEIRRIGLGVMGLADLAYALRVRYGSNEFLDLCSQTMEFIRYHSMMASVELARERGPFPEILRSIYSTNDFAWKPPTPLRPHSIDFGRPPIGWGIVERGIREYGIRNGAQTTIAPTGTIGTISGCEGYGCEPVFALAYTRRVKEKDGVGTLVLNYFSPMFVAALEEAGISGAKLEGILDSVKKTGSCQGITEVPEDIRRTFVVSGDVSVSDHVATQASLQRFVDNSISKTVNFPSTATVGDVRDAYQMAWRMGCKGLAIYVAGSRSDVVLEVQSPFSVKRSRPEFLNGSTYRSETPLGDAYITVNDTEDGEPFEVFANVGKGGSDVAAVSEALGRLISLIMRIPSSITPTDRMKEVISQLEGIGGRNHRGVGKNRITSLPDAISRVMLWHISDGTTPTTPVTESVRDLCPECGNSTLIKIEGCRKCYQCGHDECM